MKNSINRLNIKYWSLGALFFIVLDVFAQSPTLSSATTKTIKTIELEFDRAVTLNGGYAELYTANPGISTGFFSSTNLITGSGKSTLTLTTTSDLDSDFTFNDFKIPVDFVEDASNIGNLLITQTITDGIAPSLVSATATSSTTIELEFDENVNLVDPANDYSKLSSTDISFTGASNITVSGATVTLNLNPTQSVAADFTANSLNISTGFVVAGVNNNAVTGVWISDGIAPSLVSATATSSTTIALVFDEEVSVQGHYGQLESSNPDIAAGFFNNSIAILGGNTNTLTLTTSTDLPSDYELSNFIIPADFVLGGVNNTEITGQTITDGIAPSLVSATATSSTTIDLEFDEDVTLVGSATDYSKLSATGLDFMNASAISVSDATVTLTLNSAQALSSDYSTSDLAISSGFVMGGVNNLDISSQIIADGIAPSLVSATATSSTTIDLVFDENVTLVGMAIDYSNLSASGLDFSNASAMSVSDDTVTLTLNSAQALSSDYTASDLAISSGFVTGGGNNLDISSQTIADGIAPSLVSATATSKTEVELVFDEDVSLVGGVSDPMKLSATGLSFSSTATTGSDNTKLILTLSTGLEGDFTEPSDFRIDAGFVRDAASSPNQNNQITSTTVTDRIPPEFVQAYFYDVDPRDGNIDEIVVEMDDNMVVGASTALDGFSLSGTSSTVSWSVSNAMDAENLLDTDDSDKYVTLKITSGYTGTDIPPSLSLDYDPSSGTFQDNGGVQPVANTNITKIDSASVFVTSTMPVLNATDVDSVQSLTLALSEKIGLVSNKDITVLTDNYSHVINFKTNDESIVLNSESDTVTINLSAPLRENRNYFVIISEGAFDDSPVNDSPVPYVSQFTTTTDWTINTSADEINPIATITRRAATFGDLDKGTKDTLAIFDIAFSEEIDPATFDVGDIDVVLTNLEIDGNSSDGDGATFSSSHFVLENSENDQNFVLTISDITTTGTSPHRLAIKIVNNTTVIMDKATEPNSFDSQTDLTKSIFFDQTAPKISVTDLITSESQPRLFGTVNEESDVTVSVNNFDIAATLSDDDTDGVFDWEVAQGEIVSLSSGTYEVFVGATDAAGNESSVVYDLTIDGSLFHISNVYFYDTDSTTGHEIVTVEFSKDVDDTSVDPSSYEVGTQTIVDTIQNSYIQDTLNIKDHTKIADPGKPNDEFITFSLPTGGSSPSIWTGVYAFKYDKSANTDKTKALIKTKMDDQNIQASSEKLQDKSRPLFVGYTLYDDNEDGDIDKIEVELDKVPDFHFLNVKSFELGRGSVIRTSDGTEGDKLFSLFVEVEGTDTTSLRYNAEDKIQDTDGNQIPLPKNIESFTDAADPIIKSVTSYDRNSDGHLDSLVVVYSENINDSTINIGDYEISDKEAKGMTTGSIENDTIVNLRWNNTDALGTDVVQLVYDAGTSGSTADFSNNFLSDITFSNVDDKIPAVFLNAYQYDMDSTGNIDEIVLEFSEPVNESTIDISNFNLTPSGTIDNTLPFSIAKNPKDSTASDEFVTLEVTVTGTVPVGIQYTEGTLSLTDLQNNLLSANSAINTRDVAAPFINKFYFFDHNKDNVIDEVTVEFGENINDITVAAADFTLFNSAGDSIAMKGIISPSLVHDSNDADAKVANDHFITFEPANNVASTIVGLEYNRDGEPNKATADISDNKLQNDTITAPTMESSFEVTRKTTLRVNIELNRSGNVYYVLYDNDTARPSVDDVLNGTRALIFGTLALDANENNDIGITLPADSTEYDLYLVAEDAVHGSATSPQLIEVKSGGVIVTAPDILSDICYQGESVKLGKIVISESIKTDFVNSGGSNTFRLQLPTGYDFVDLSSVSTSTNLGGDLNSVSVAKPRLGVLEITYGSSSSSYADVLDVITISNIAIQNNDINDFDEDTLSLNGGGTGEIYWAGEKEDIVFATFSSRGRYEQPKFATDDDQPYIEEISDFVALGDNLNNVASYWNYDGLDVTTFTPFTLTTPNSADAINIYGDDGLATPLTSWNGISGMSHTPSLASLGLTVDTLGISDYYITVTNQYGCESTSTKYSVAFVQADTVSGETSYSEYNTTGTDLYFSLPTGHTGFLESDGEGLKRAVYVTDTTKSVFNPSLAGTGEHVLTYELEKESSGTLAYFKMNFTVKDAIRVIDGSGLESDSTNFCYADADYGINIVDPSIEDTLAFKDVRAFYTHQGTRYDISNEVLKQSTVSATPLLWEFNPYGDYDMSNDDLITLTKSDGSTTTTTFEGGANIELITRVQNVNTGGITDHAAQTIRVYAMPVITAQDGGDWGGSFAKAYCSNDETFTINVGHIAEGENPLDGRIEYNGPIESGYNLILFDSDDDVVDSSPKSKINFDPTSDLFMDVDGNYEYGKYSLIYTTPELTSALCEMSDTATFYVLEQPMLPKLDSVSGTEVDANIFSGIGGLQVVDTDSTYVLEYTASDAPVQVVIGDFVTDANKEGVSDAVSYRWYTSTEKFQNLRQTQSGTGSHIFHFNKNYDNVSNALNDTIYFSKFLYEDYEGTGFEGCESDLRQINIEVFDVPDAPVLPLESEYLYKKNDGEYFYEYCGEAGAILPLAKVSIADSLDNDEADESYLLVYKGNNENDEKVLVDTLEASNLELNIVEGALAFSNTIPDEGTSTQIFYLSQVNHNNQFKDPSSDVEAYKGTEGPMTKVTVNLNRTPDAPPIADFTNLVSTEDDNVNGIYKFCSDDDENASFTFRSPGVEDYVYQWNNSSHSKLFKSNNVLNDSLGLSLAYGSSLGNTNTESTDFNNTDTQNNYKFYVRQFEFTNTSISGEINGVTTHFVGCPSDSIELNVTVYKQPDTLYFNDHVSSDKVYDLYNYCEEADLSEDSLRVDSNILKSSESGTTTLFQWYSVEPSAITKENYFYHSADSALSMTEIASKTNFNVNVSFTDTESTDTTTTIYVTQLTDGFCNSEPRRVDLIVNHRPVVAIVDEDPVVDKIEITDQNEFCWDDNNDNNPSYFVYETSQRKPLGESNIDDGVGNTNGRGYVLYELSGENLENRVEVSDADKFNITKNVTIDIGGVEYTGQTITLDLDSLYDDNGAGSGLKNAGDDQNYALTFEYIDDKGCTNPVSTASKHYQSNVGITLHPKPFSYVYIEELGINYNKEDEVSILYKEGEGEENSVVCVGGKNVKHDEPRASFDIRGYDNGNVNQFQGTMYLFDSVDYAQNGFKGDTINFSSRKNTLDYELSDFDPFITDGYSNDFTFVFEVENIETGCENVVTQDLEVHKLPVVAGVIGGVQCEGSILEISADTIPSFAYYSLTDSSSSDGLGGNQLYLEWSFFDENEKLYTNEDASEDLVGLVGQESLELGTGEIKKTFYSLLTAVTAEGCTNNFKANEDDITQLSDYGSYDIRSRTTIDIQVGPNPSFTWKNAVVDDETEFYLSETLIGHDRLSSAYIVIDPPADASYDGTNARAKSSIRDIPTYFQYKNIIPKEERTLLDNLVYDSLSSFNFETYFGYDRVIKFDKKWDGLNAGDHEVMVIFISKNGCVGAYPQEVVFGKTIEVDAGGSYTQNFSNLPDTDNYFEKEGWYAEKQVDDVLEVSDSVQRIRKSSFVYANVDTDHLMTIIKSSDNTINTSQPNEDHYGWYTLKQTIDSATVDERNIGQYDSIFNTYYENEISWIYSPVFDLSALERPMLTMDMIYNFDGPKEGAVIQYSIDKESTWHTLGDYLLDETNNEYYGTGLNWYNSDNVASDPGLQESVFGAQTARGWSGENADNLKWTNVRHSLEKLVVDSADVDFDTNIRFRIAISAVSDTKNAFLGLGIDNFSIVDRQKNVLVEQFLSFSHEDGDDVTAMNTNSAKLEESIDQYASNLSTDLLKITYRSFFGFEDMVNLMNQSDPSTRAVFYGVDNVTAALDGRIGASVNSDNDDLKWTQNDMAQAVLQTPYFKFHLADATDSNDDQDENWIKGRLKVEAIADLKKTDVNGDAKDVELLVFVAVLDADTTSYDITGDTKYNGHNNIVRKLLPGASGAYVKHESIAVGDSLLFDDKKYFDFEWQIPTSVIDASNLALLVFVQDREHGLIYQSEYYGSSSDLLKNKLPTPKDRVLSVDDVFDTESRDYKLVPNPANDVVNIVFDQRPTSNTRWQIYDQSGRIYDGGEVKAGQSRFSIYTSNYQTGIYFIRMINAEGSLDVKKLMVVH